MQIMDGPVMVDKPIKERVRAIVQFGYATPTSGFKAGEYYQVTLDPSMQSPKGNYIRFGLYPGDEINGWQLISAMTVCEVLGPAPILQKPPEGFYEEHGEEIVMRHIKEE